MDDRQDMPGFEPAHRIGRPSARGQCRSGGHEESPYPSLTRGGLGRDATKASNVRRACPQLTEQLPFAIAEFDRRSRRFLTHNRRIVRCYSLPVALFSACGEGRVGGRRRQRRRAEIPSPRPSTGRGLGVAAACSERKHEQLLIRAHTSEVFENLDGVLETLLAAASRFKA